jgi:hypothetical protein
MTDLGIHKWGKLEDRAEKEGTNLWRAKIRRNQNIPKLYPGQIEALQNFQLPSPPPSKRPANF